MAEYGATIGNRPGSYNIQTDGLSRISPASVAIIDSTNEYNEPPGGPADIADDLLPSIIDGLDRQTLSAAQQSDFLDVWANSDEEDSGYIIYYTMVYHTVYEPPLQHPPNIPA